MAVRKRLSRAFRLLAAALEEDPMTRPATNYRDRRRELARELANVPTPPPPADLLDAIAARFPPISRR